MFNLVITIDGESFNDWQKIELTKLVGELAGLDAWWDFTTPRKGGKSSSGVTIGTDGVSATIEFLDDEAKARWTDFIKQVADNENSLLKNDDDIGKAPVYTLTGTRITGWDYQWDPTHPNYKG